MAKIDFLIAAQSTFFDEDDGWVCYKFPPGFYLTRNVNINGWKSKQIRFRGQWYDLDPDVTWVPRASVKDVIF